MDIMDYPKDEALGNNRLAWIFKGLLFKLWKHSYRQKNLFFIYLKHEIKLNIQRNISLVCTAHLHLKCLRLHFVNFTYLCIVTEDVTLNFNTNTIFSKKTWNYQTIAIWWNKNSKFPVLYSSLGFESLINIFLLALAK